MPTPPSARAVSEQELAQYANVRQSHTIGGETKIKSNSWRSWCMVLMLALLSACAAITSLNHTFDFDPLKDSPDVKVLDWRYSVYGAQPWQVDRAVSGGRGAPGIGVSGNFPVGDFIYVKWQVPPDATVHERRIELKGLLPRSMEGVTLVLMFRSNQPHVYLVQPGRDGACPGTACPMTLSSDVVKVARVFSRGAVTQIYPGPPKPIVLPLPKLSKE